MPLPEPLFDQWYTCLLLIQWATKNRVCAHSILKANKCNWKREESLVGLADKRPQLALHLRTLNFAFFQIMFLRTMLFRSLKNLFFCVACRCPRAVKPNFPAFEFIHVRFIETCCREYHITVVKLSYMKHFDG
jgi:hypothetical protein